MDFRFRTSFTGKPVDQEKTKSFGCHKAKNCMLISGMASEKRAMLKKRYLRINRSETI
jgi:hypothetical protein